MSDIQGKKLPKLMILARTLLVGSFVVSFIGWGLFFKIFFIEVFVSSETSKHELQRGILTGFFFVSCGLSMLGTALVLVNIANDCFNFFGQTDREENFTHILQLSYKVGIFFTVSSLVILLFIEPYNDVLFIVLAICCCINIWCLAIIFYYRNTTLRLLKHSE